MRCKYCGCEIEDGSAFCKYCGAAVKKDETHVEMEQNKTYGSSNNDENVIAIVGFVLSFIFAVGGLICSIIGYRNAINREDGKFKGLALAGIIISSASIVLSVIVSVVWGATVAKLMTDFFQFSSY